MTTATVEFKETVSELKARVTQEKAAAKAAAKAARLVLDQPTGEQLIELNTLAETIGELHREIETGAEALAVRYVEMHGLLTQAREAVGHGKWLQWVVDHEKVLGFGERQARRYLREADVRTADLESEATRLRDRRARVKKIEIENPGQMADPVEPQPDAQPEVPVTRWSPSVVPAQEPTVAPHITTEAGVAAEGIDFAVNRIAIAVEVIEAALGKGYLLTEEQAITLGELSGRLNDMEQGWDAR